MNTSTHTASKRVAVFFNKFFKGWSWVLAFSLVCLCVYGQAMKKKSALASELKGKILSLQHESSLLSAEREQLQLEIASQNDPAWIELVLMRHLGVVPEGQVKVHFKQESVRN